MSVINKSGLPPVEIRAQIDEAQQALLAATTDLGEALVIKAAVPDRDAGPEQAAVEAARRRIEQFNAMLPIVEKAEAQALEAARGKLAEEQRRRMAKELKGLVIAALQFSAAYQNAVSAWRRGCDAIHRARALLPAEMRLHGLGWERRLSAHWLHEKCTLEIARLGLVPVTDHPYGTGVLSAPGARADAVNTLRQASSPQTIPPLEAEVRQMLADVMAAAMPTAPGAPVSENGSGLPKVATDPEAAPAAPTAAPAANGEESHAGR